MHRVQLSNCELADMYSTCIGLSARGKISQKNAWKLDLVNNMDRILDMEKQVSKRTHFQKASHTIHAASQIYGHRVDSVHTNAYQVLTNFTNAPAQQDFEEGGDESGAAGQRRRKRTGVNTIATVAFINVNLDKVTSEIDPMFHKTSSAFDEGGAKGLLMNNLTVQNGCDIVFDSSTTFNDDACVEEPPELEQTSWISEMRAELKYKAKTFKLKICPPIKGFHERIAKAKAQADKLGPQPGSQNSSMTMAQNTASQESGPMERKLNFDESMTAEQGGDGFQGVDNPDLFFGVEDNEELFEAERQEQMLQDRLQECDPSANISTMGALRTHNPWGDDNNFAEVLAGDFNLYQETKNKLRGFSATSPNNEENILGDATGLAAQGGIKGVGGEGATFINPRALNWAGPDQWFYRRLRYRRLQAKLAKQAEAEKRKNKRIGNFLDYKRVLTGAYVPEMALAPPRRINSTVLSERVQQAQATKMTILPTDLAWKEKFFTRLFTKPDFYCGFNRNVIRQRRSQTEEDEDAELQKGWYDYENDADLNFVSNVDDLGPGNWQDIDDVPAVLAGDGQNPDEELQLIKAPDKLRHIEVDFSTIQKRIDVKALKTSIFMHIEKICKEERNEAAAAATAASGESSKERIDEEKQEIEKPSLDLEGGKTKVECFEGVTSFQDTITSLRSMSKNQLTQLSVPFCFMCILHLANEVHLRFSGTTAKEKEKALTNFSIVLDKPQEGSGH